MDFRQQKLLLAFGVVTIGMLIAVLWHGYYGVILREGYPDDTFLFRYEARFSDFTDLVPLAATPGVHNNYFPAAYLIFCPFIHCQPLTGVLIFLGLCMVGLYFLLNKVLRQVAPGFLLRFGAILAFLGSYPVLYCLDRGNTDILLVLLVSWALYFYQRRRFTLSFFLLLPAICFKLYPAVLLLLFFRRRLLHWVFLGPLIFLLVNAGLFLSYPGTVSHNLSLLNEQFSFYNGVYTMGQKGVSNSASAWNLFRLIVWFAYGVIHGHFAWPLPHEIVALAFKVYYWIFLAIGLLVAGYALLLESSWIRRAIAALVYLTVSAAGAGDYKLMYDGVAVVLLILCTERRPADWTIVALLALCLIPKREIILSFVGASDSNYADCSIGVIVNPLCMLIALALLMGDGWRRPSPPFRQRLAKFSCVLHLPDIYRAIFGMKSGVIPAHRPR